MFLLGTILAGGACGVGVFCLFRILQKSDLPPPGKDNQTP